MTTPKRPDAVTTAQLALWLSWPSVLGEFSPVSLLGRTVDRVSASPRLERGPRTEELSGPFSDSVRSCMAGHEVVAVSVSGGLDSLAVLLEASRVAELDGRKVIAAVAQMTDDTGGSNVPVVRRMIEAADLRNVTLHVTTLDDEPDGAPEWLADGPHLDALPLANRQLAEVAREDGATVMLGGNGADELLGAVRYLFGRFIAARDWSALRAYWADSIGVRPAAWRAESLAFAARLLPRSWRAAAFFASEWPELCDGRAPEVIGRSYRDEVAAWSAQWVADAIKFHAGQHRSWARMAAWDAVFPLHVLPGPGPIPLRHPFLTPDFVSAALRLPLSRRYDPRLPHAYWRQKAQVVGLLPEQVRQALPTAKQTFTNELTARYRAEKVEASCLIACGVVSSLGWRATVDPLIINRVNKLETWLDEAFLRGFTVIRS